MSLILALLLSQASVEVVSDTPVMDELEFPPRLINENGDTITITGAESLLNDTICFTGPKARIERDAKVSCENERDELRATNAFWSTPLVIVVATVAAVIGVSATVGVLKATNHLR